MPIDEEASNFHLPENKIFQQVQDATAPAHTQKKKQKKQKTKKKKKTGIAEKNTQEEWQIGVAG